MFQDVKINYESWMSEKKKGEWVKVLENSEIVNGLYPSINIKEFLKWYTFLFS